MTEKTEFAVFKHEKFGEIRTIEIDGEPWFAGKDIAIALGYRDTINALKAHVYEDDKMGWQFGAVDKYRCTNIKKYGII